jgi:hypothetical protein
MAGSLLREDFNFTTLELSSPNLEGLVGMLIDAGLMSARYSSVNSGHRLNPFTVSPRRLHPVFEPIGFRVPL